MPHHLHTTGVGWLVASVVLVGLSMVVFAGELRGPAVAVTVPDDAVVGWLAGLDAPWLARTWQALAFLGSWWVLNTLGWGLLLALLALRRFRQLIIVLVVTQLLTMIIFDWGAQHVHQHERFFLARIEPWELPSTLWQAHQEEGIQQHRWWTIRELERATESIAPQHLPKLLRALLAEGLPAQPIDLGSEARQHRDGHRSPARSP